MLNFFQYSNRINTGFCLRHVPIFHPEISSSVLFLIPFRGNDSLVQYSYGQCCGFESGGIW
jgi:hypothetical protein